MQATAEYGPARENVHGEINANSTIEPRRPEPRKEADREAKAREKESVKETGRKTGPKTAASVNRSVASLLQVNLIGHRAENG